MSGYVPRKLRGKAAGTRKSAETEPRPAARKPAGGKPSTKAPAPRRPSPRPSPGGRGVSPRTSAKSLRRQVRRLRRFAYILSMAAIAMVLLTAANLGGWMLWGGDVGKDGLDERSQAVVRAAKAAGSALFSYDYRDFDASVKNGSAHATGLFHDEYIELTEGLRDTVTKENAKVTADVVDVAVVAEDTTFVDDEKQTYEGVMEVLTFMDQTTTNDNLKGMKVDSSRVLLTMVETDEGWKVVDTDGL